MSNATTAAVTVQSDDATPYPLRNDTMLGVCAALGDLFGINPVYLRIAIGSLVIFNLMMAVGIYLGLGVVVMLGHLVFPRRREVVEAPAAASVAVEANDRQPASEKLAA